LNPTTNQFAEALVNADYVACFERASREAGGGGWDYLKDKTMEQAMHILARNGLRFCWREEYHIDQQYETAQKMAAAAAFLPNGS
jgi:hypothetical protein